MTFLQIFGFLVLCAIGVVVLLQVGGVIDIRFARDRDGFYVSVERE